METGCGQSCPDTILIMILGIDYGLRHLGFAISEGNIASPGGTVDIKNPGEALEAVSQLVKRWAIKKIVIGISEGKSKSRALGFGRKVKNMLRLPVEFVDETLSSLEAASGKRISKDKEHSKAAAIILQRWLDNNK